jgi:hypothetical protein
MRQFRTSGSVRGVAREGDSYRDMFKSSSMLIVLEAVVFALTLNLER